MDDARSWIQARLGGFAQAMGVRVTEATPERVELRVDVAEVHLQPYGLVHGGVHAGLIESACSIGAALHAMPQGRTCVGLENHSSFLRAVRSGELVCVATPLVVGRRSHVWEAEVRDDQDRRVATGRVRMLILEPGATADGVEVGVTDE